MLKEECDSRREDSAIQKACFCGRKLCTFSTGQV